MSQGPAYHARTHSTFGTDPVRLNRTLLFIMDGGGSALTTGVKGDVQLHAPFEIKSWTLLADTTGSIEMNIWKDVYANYPPTNADSITGGDDPAISSDDSATGTPTSNWTTTIAAGDTLRFNIESVSTITRCTLALELLG